MSTQKPNTIQAELARLEAKSKHPGKVKLAKTKQLLFSINKSIRNQLADLQKRSVRRKVAP